MPKRSKASNNNARLFSVKQKIQDQNVKKKTSKVYLLELRQPSEDSINANKTAKRRRINIESKNTENKNLDIQRKSRKHLINTSYEPMKKQKQTFKKSNYNLIRNKQTEKGTKFKKNAVRPLRSFIKSWKLVNVGALNKETLNVLLKGTTSPAIKYIAKPAKNQKKNSKDNTFNYIAKNIENPVIYNNEKYNYSINNIKQPLYKKEIIFNENSKDIDPKLLLLMENGNENKFCFEKPTTVQRVRIDMPQCDTDVRDDDCDCTQEDCCLDGETSEYSESFCSCLNVENDACLKVIDSDQLTKNKCTIKIAGRNYAGTFNVCLDPTIDRVVYNTLKEINKIEIGKQNRYASGYRHKKRETVIKNCYTVLKSLFTNCTILNSKSSLTEESYSIVPGKPQCLNTSKSVVRITLRDTSKLDKTKVCKHIAENAVPSKTVKKSLHKKTEMEKTIISPEVIIVSPEKAILSRKETPFSPKETISRRRETDISPEKIISRWRETDISSEKIISRRRETDISPETISRRRETFISPEETKVIYENSTMKDIHEEEENGFVDIRSSRMTNGKEQNKYSFQKSGLRTNTTIQVGDQNSLRSALVPYQVSHPEKSEKHTQTYQKMSLPNEGEGPRKSVAITTVVSNGNEKKQASVNTDNNEIIALGDRENDHEKHKSQITTTIDLNRDENENQTEKPLKVSVSTKVLPDVTTDDSRPIVHCKLIPISNVAPYGDGQNNQQDVSIRNKIIQKPKGSIVQENIVTMKGDEHKDRKVQQKPTAPFVEPIVVLNGKQITMYKKDYNMPSGDGNSNNQPKIPVKVEDVQEITSNKGKQINILLNNGQVITVHSDEQPEDRFKIITRPYVGRPVQAGGDDKILQLNDAEIEKQFNKPKQKYVAEIVTSPPESNPKPCYCQNDQIVHTAIIPTNSHLQRMVFKKNLSDISRIYSKSKNGYQNRANPFYRLTAETDKNKSLLENLDFPGTNNNKDSVFLMNDKVNNFKLWQKNKEVIPKSDIFQRRTTKTVTTNFKVFKSIDTIKSTGDTNASTETVPEIITTSAQTITVTKIENISNTFFSEKEEGIWKRSQLKFDKFGGINRKMYNVFLKKGSNSGEQISKNELSNNSIDLSKYNSSTERDLYGLDLELNSSSSSDKMKRKRKLKKYQKKQPTTSFKEKQEHNMFKFKSNFKKKIERK